MAQVEEVESSNIKYQIIEELFEDKDAKVFDTIFLNGPIDVVKPKLNLLKYQGTYIHNVYQSYFHYFTTDQTLNYPKFIDWCSINYSSEREIMDLLAQKSFVYSLLWLL